MICDYCGKDDRSVEEYKCPVVDQTGKLLGYKIRRLCLQCWNYEDEYVDEEEY